MGDVVQLADVGRLLQVAVGDVAVRVISGDQAIHQVLCQRLSPHSRGMAVCKKYSSESISAGVHGADDLWVFGNEFRKLCRPDGEV